MVGTPNYPRSFPDAFRQLKSQLADTRTAANTRQAMTIVKAATLTFLGDLVIEAGGRLIARHSSTVAALVVGKDAFNENLRGIWLYRPEGQRIFRSYGDDLGNGFWAWYDKSGTILFSEDAVTGWGMAEPKLNYPLPVRTDVGSIAAIWPQTTSTSFVTVAECLASITHPRIEVYALTATAGGAGGEYQVLVNDTALYDTPQTGSWTAITSVPGWGTTVKPGQQLVSVKLQARVASGAGTAYVQVLAVRGIGSP